MTNLYRDALGYGYTLFQGLNTDPREAKVIDPYTPDALYDGPKTTYGLPDVVGLGSSLIGSPKPHHALQMDAMKYGRQNLGFDNTVAFLVNWPDMDSSWFVYDVTQEWLQLDTQGRIVLPDNLWARYLARHPGIDKETRFFNDND